MILENINPTLVHIFNLCMRTGTFPKSMQIAKVVMIYKSGYITNPSNYRPISILPIFSKGFEHILHCRLMSYFEKHHLLTERQFGFRKNSSTELALLTQKEIILRNIESKQITLGVLIDFSKAFDSISHTILLQKLARYGVRGIPLSLFSSYLSHRCQKVVINGLSSSLNRINCGVPQGSLLGPLLFSIYINDIVSISNEADFIIYADDTSLLFSGSDPDYLIANANRVLEKLRLWSELNCLKINADKTKAIFFSARNKSVMPCANLLINNSVISFVDNVRILGVFFTSNLSWSTHVDHVHSRASRIFCFLYRYRTHMSKSVVMMLYYALIYSHFNYCLLVWGTATKTNLDRLLTLQKKFIRVLDCLPYHHTTAGLFQKHSLISIHNLYDLRLINYYITALKKSLTGVISLYNLSEHSWKYNYRTHKLWNIPRCRTNYGQQSVSYRLPRILNESQLNPSHVTRKTVRDYFINLRD